MITTTSPNIEGHQIIEYKKIVFGEVITGVNFVKDIGAGLRNIFGGRSQGYEDELIQAREEAIQEMESRAAQIGANAIIGVDIDYEVLGADNGMLMVTASGTAVIIETQDY
ncbi:putative heavy metal-binding protein [Listeria costaricensis]|uniref:putative heavy metal-binding protein n=1 Tax=Listeria costaricensis TaxID=2026604 RepID=UPI000C072872|nr:putative heavy metal-binding protein [Listeria costaricensis]